VASIGGIQNFASNLAGVITAFFTGLVVQITGNYVVALVTAGLLALVGAFSYLFVVGPIEPLPELGGARTEVRTA
jgi:MFS transporter, ACS family, D-galactonate transporter